MVVDLVVNIAVEAWLVLTEMAPYLLFGFAVAGALFVYLKPETVERHLGVRGMKGPLKATLFGIPLPLCSCGVIPVAASLRKHGATRGATASFLLSTPQTGVDSILVTFGLLGPVMAIFRPLVAFVTGIAGGVLIEYGAGGPAADADEPRCADACCTEDQRGNKLVEGARYAFVTLPRDIAKSLLLGLVLVGIIAALVPDDFFMNALGTGFAAMVVMMLVGLPMYVCATASVPIAAALIAKGVTPGAALVFLITGPATNAATITTIWRIMGRRAAVLFLAIVLVSALASGLLLDYIMTESPLAGDAVSGWELPASVGTVSAVLLLAILGYALVKPREAAGGKETETMGTETTRLSIDGMTCEHCRDSVVKALESCPGVASVDVDLKAGTATVAGAERDEMALLEAVKEAGYEARIGGSG